MQLRRRQRGDTIIEVMLAFAVFALLVVGAISVMNRGVASAQEALETTLVREQIDGQAEALRFLYQSYMSDSSSPTNASALTFAGIRADAENNEDRDASEFGHPQCLTGIPRQNPFVINPLTGGVIKTLHSMSEDEAPAYAQITYNDDGTAAPYGLWIEAVKGGATNQPKFIDFHIRACWYSVTSDAPRTLGTIVRLYMPTTESGQFGVGTPLPPITPYALNGGSFTDCDSSPPYQYPDSAPLPPGAPYTAPYPPAPFPCTPVGTSVYSCTNYDVQYDPGINHRARYNLTLTYHDVVCGSGVTETMPSSYNYKVAVYVNGDFRAQGLLGATSPSYRFDDIGVVEPGSKIQIRWWNNHFIVPGGQDPDFTIDQLAIEKVSDE